MTISIEEIIAHNIKIAEQYESRVRSLTAEYQTKDRPSWVYMEIETAKQRAKAYRADALALKGVTP